MTNKVTSKNWTKHASKYIKSLAKIANEELAIANGETPTAENGAETAGPQEVVDAIEVIVSELEEVQEAIPAEPTQELDDEPVAEPEPEVEAETDIAPEVEPVEEEEEKLEVAKLKTVVASLSKKLAQQDLEKTAERYAQLYNGPRVQESKFDEVIKSGKTAEHWDAKIAAIEEYRSIEGINSSEKTANISNWITPRSKTAKQQVGYLTSL